LFAAALGAAASAVAQVTLPSRQDLDPARATPIAAAPRGDLFPDLKPAPCAFQGSDVKVTLTAVQFQGATGGGLALSDAALASTYADLLKREAPVSAICDIRDRAATLYLRRGVLASVVIPEQRIADGRLVLTVVEARIASVTYHGDIGPAQRQAALYLDHLRGMTPFDLDVAERYLLLASDLPGVRVQTTLRPSPTGPGAVDLDIALSRDAVDGALMTQNHGSRTIGRDLSLARLNLNSFTRLGERTSLIAYGTLSSDEQRVIQATERLNLGGDGLAADLSAAWAWTRPGAALKPLDLEGDSFAGSARLSYPLMRHRRHNLTLGFGLDWVDQTVAFGGGAATLTEDHLRVFFLRLDGHVAPRNLQARSMALTGSLELRQGIHGLGASPQGDLDASRFGGKPDATVLRAEGEVGGQIAGPLVGKLVVAWQHTDDPLLSYEEYSVGNLTVGRGYDPSIASGDRAVSASFELTTVPLPAFEGRAAWRPYAFYDAARLTNIGPGADRLNLGSAGIGLRAQVAGGLAIDLAWAKPLDSPFAIGGKPSDRLLVQLVFSR